MERRLGRGLRSLLAEPEPPEPRTEIELARIQPNPFQPRRSFSASGLEELRDSIRNHGVLQPVVLREVGEGFELIAGERRTRAARLAGLERIPAVLRNDVDDDAMLELALVENVQRQDLNPIEKAQGYHTLMDRLGLTQEAVAQKVGLKRSTVTNLLRLLDLPAPAQSAVAEGVISAGHGRALLGLEDAGQQVALLKQVARRDLSVREVERRVRALRAPAAAPGATGKAGPKPPSWVAAVDRRLQDHLGTQARVVPGQGERGQIVIDYFDHATLERLLAIVAPPKTI